MISEVDNSMFKDKTTTKFGPAQTSSYHVEIECEDIDSKLGEKIACHVKFANTPDFSPSYNNGLTCSPTTRLKFTEVEDYAMYAYFVSKVTELHKNGKENSKLPTIKITACNRSKIPVMIWTLPKCEIVNLGGLVFSNDNVSNVEYEITFKAERCDVEMCRAWHKSI